MATVYIEYGDDANAVQAVVDRELLHNPGWSGATINIERDDYRWIECSNDIAGTQLLAQINAALDAD